MFNGDSSYDSEEGFPYRKFFHFRYVALCRKTLKKVIHACKTRSSAESQKKAF